MLGDVAHARVLDLYAGSGALGIEALSRGAADAVFVERNRGALGAIEANLRSLGLASRATVLPFAVERSASRLAKLGPFDLVLVDPPYADVTTGSVARALATLLEAGIVARGGRLVLEHAKRDVPPELPRATVERTRRHGETNVTIYDVHEAGGETTDVAAPSGAADAPGQ